MSESKPIVIQARYVGEQPLLSIIESNIDPDNVAVQRTEFAVKAIEPLDLLIVATSTYVLEEFLLKPLLHPIAEKFNWKKAVARYLRPIDSLNLIITIDSEHLAIEAPLEMHNEITAEIWALIQKALDIVQRQPSSTAFSRIRFTFGDTGNLLVLGYTQSRPTHIINLDEGKLTEIPSGQIIDDGSEPSWEKWGKKELRKAEAYRKFAEDSLRKGNDDTR